MAFSINKKEENGLSILILEDSTTGTTAGILPNNGALLHSFEVDVKGEKLNVIANYTDAEDLKNDIGDSFKSCKLSPFACRVADAKYTYNGKLFEFPDKFKDGNAIHGLLYNKPFTVVSQSADDNSASVTLQYEYKNENPGYPYNYVCEITYTLTKGSLLQLKTTVTNKDNQTIPVQDGWHPYFSLGNDVNDCLFQFSSDNIIEFNEKLIPTGRQLEYTEFNTPKPLYSTELDNCFSLKQASNEPVAVFSNPRNGVRVSFWPDETYPYLQIYTPPHRKSLAIENLSAVPDCFNNKIGLILLPQGESKTFKVTYKVEIVEE